MARRRKRVKETEEVKKELELKPIQKAELPKPSENKIKFMVWFSTALDRFKGLKPHHMSAIKAYFIRDLNLMEVTNPEVFDEAILKFGFGRK